MASVDPQVGPYAVGDRVLTKYEIKGLLGRGGHAFVYHGHDGFLERDVAIKVIINPTEPGRDLRKRAQLEARVLCRLNHPNVVSVIDAGATEEGFVYIIMERLLGRTLREALVELRTLTVPEALAIGSAVADGVQAAHAEKTVHRDLKPENVFIQENNAAKVLDFGIAKFLGQDAKTTQKDLLHGTLPYMSPEHLQGLKVTEQSDIFALGAMLYEMLGGRAPCLLGIEEPTMNAIAWAQINRRPPPLTERAPHVPRHVDRVVQRMIAKSPADRYQSMQEVADALRATAERFKSESAEAVPPDRALWKKAAPTGNPSTWTTALGPSTFGSTEVIGESAALAPMPGQVRTMDAASDPAASITTATGVVPNTGSGLAVHASAESRSSSVKRVVAIGLAIGTAAGIALGWSYAPEKRAEPPAPGAPSLATAAVHAESAVATTTPVAPGVTGVAPAPSAVIPPTLAAASATPPAPMPSAGKVVPPAKAITESAPPHPQPSSVWVAAPPHVMKAASHGSPKSAYGADDIR